MAKFLSNDRKIILKSAATGVGIISVLTCALSLDNDSIILWILSIFGLLAVYWCIPTWFSRNRQLHRQEAIYLNADNEEVKRLSDRAIIIGVVLGLVTNVLLIFFAYDKLASILIDSYPTYENAFINILIILTVTTPYLTRHIYCFVFNRPMDTSFVFNGTGAPYIHKYDDSWSRNTATSPRYSNLSYNIYNHRYK